MMTPAEYVIEVKAALIACSLVSQFEVVEEWVQPDRGYIRVRARLCNGVDMFLRHTTANENVR